MFGIFGSGEEELNDLPHGEKIARLWRKGLYAGQLASWRWIWPNWRSRAGRSQTGPKARSWRKKSERLEKVNALLEQRAYKAEWMVGKPGRLKPNRYITLPDYV